MLRLWAIAPKCMKLFERSSDKLRTHESYETPKLVYPRLYKDAILMLTKLDGTFLCRVRLRNFSTMELDLVRPVGMLSFPLFEDGEKLAVTGSGENNLPFSLSGIVTVSNRVNIRLGSLALMTGTNQRESPRYSVYRKANIYRPELVNSAKKPEPCDLIDISMAGAKIHSDEVYAEGQTLKLQVELYERAGKISFMCQVVRVEYDKQSRNEYGLLFEELPLAKKQYLREDLDWLAEHAHC